MLEEISDYSHKAKILRQIQSNKARRFGRINNAQSVATVIVSAFLTFIGFSGLDRIAAYFSLVKPEDKAKAELLFNLGVFSLFVLVILHLVFHFNKRQAEAEAAVVSLTAFINEVEDMIATGRRAAHHLGPSDLDLVRHKYESLIRVIPSNTDREYLGARKDFREKEQKKAQLQLHPKELFDPLVHEKVVITLAQSSTMVLNVLNAIREVDSRLYLAGGLIRNLVWDFLHGYDSPTPIDDVDVVYFDKLSITKEHDVALEERLRSRIANLRWSVKNQARMHTPNEDAPYGSLSDAVSKWPETCTSFVVRLTESGQLDIMAPHGFADLLRLVVRPTDHFSRRLERYQQRLASKNWSATWPRLLILR